MRVLAVVLGVALAPVGRAAADPSFTAAASLGVERVGFDNEADGVTVNDSALIAVEAGVRPVPWLALDARLASAVFVTRSTLVGGVVHVFPFGYSVVGVGYSRADVDWPCWEAHVGAHIPIANGSAVEILASYGLYEQRGANLETESLSLGWRWK